MGGTFFVSWQLWQQMTFVLFGAMVAVMAAGWIKNFYSWHKDRRFARPRPKNPGWTYVSNDLEARGMAEIDSIPFGVKALESGLQVEGVWISQPATPVQTPSPGSPVLTGKPSPVPSLIGGLSSRSSPSGSITPSDFLQADYKVARPEMVRTSRIPSFALDATSTDLYDDGSHLSEHTSTLEALEGRRLDIDEIQRRYMRNHRSTYSRTQSIGSDGSSTRDSGPSPPPPELTDGTSQSETTDSTSRPPPLSAYLSESSHRMSHVAETGQIHPRMRLTKVFQPSIMTGARTFSHPGVKGSQGSMHDRLSSAAPFTRSTDSARSPGTFESTSPVSTALTIPSGPRRASHEPHRTRMSGTNLPVFAPRHTRAIASTQVIAGQSPSPILFEYMSRSVVQESSSAIFAPSGLDPLDHDASPSSFSSQQPRSLSSRPHHTKQAVSLTHNDDFRKVNANFEVARGAKGSLALPIKLPTLEHSAYAGTDKRKSKKLQKKRPRAQSIS